jgi:hypothetical protein
MKAKFMQQSDSLYYYNGAAIFYRDSSLNKEIEENVAGFNSFKKIFDLLAKSMIFHDRSGVITTPIKTVTVPGLELPKFNPLFNETFEEITIRKARMLLDHANNTNRKLAIMYSGGIDSTLVLVTMLKVATSKEINDSIIVLMDGNSICENKKFYEDYVVKQFTIKNSQFFNQYIGSKDYIIVTGEGNDQLFGSQVVIDNMNYFGPSTTKETIDEFKIIQHFRNIIKDTPETEKIFLILNSICKAAPIPIDTIFKWFWWINFTCKWQSVFLRSAAFIPTKNQNDLKLFDNYFMFFDDSNFQQWSMNNSDNLIGENLKQYKQICKNIIYDFNKDSDYRDFKVKIGSLFKVLLKKKSFTTIDENLNFSYEFDKKYINYNNSFIEN